MSTSEAVKQWGATNTANTKITVTKIIKGRISRKKDDDKQAIIDDDDEP